MLAPLTAAVALIAAPCPKGPAALTAFDDAQGKLRFALLPEDSPLLLRAPREDDVLTVTPILDARTATEAASHAREARCAETATVSGSHIRAPIGLARAGAPVYELVLAPKKGTTDLGSDEEARVGRVFDLASDKSEASAHLPMRARRPKIVRTPAGDTLAIEIDSAPFGTAAVLFGPVLRLDAPAAATSTLALRNTQALRHRSWLTGRATEVRLALDDRAGALRIGDRIHADVPDYGGIDRPFTLTATRAFDPGDTQGRFFVAHGLAVGLPLLSIVASLTNAHPACVTLCSSTDQPIPFDASFLDRIRARSAEDLRSSNVTFRTLEIATVALAFASVLVPSARRGVASRAEMIEDAMIIGEGMLVGLSTPLWLQRRIGRARPNLFHPTLGPTLTGSDAVGAPLMALNTTVVSSAFSAAVTLMILEESGPGWIFPASMALGGMALTTAYWEVHSGAVFPSDVPLAVIEGLLSGAGTALWHSIFWRGWPGDTDRGDLPLRLRGLDLSPALGVSGVFGMSLAGRFE